MHSYDTCWWTDSAEFATNRLEAKIKFFHKLRERTTTRAAMWKCFPNFQNSNISPLLHYYIVDANDVTSLSPINRLENKTKFSHKFRKLVIKCATKQNFYHNFDFQCRKLLLLQCLYMPAVGELTYTFSANKIKLWNKFLYKFCKGTIK